MKTMAPELIAALRACDVEAETRRGRRRLLFSPPVEAAFRQDTLAKRRFRFRRTALFGLVVYNLFLVGDLMILDDVARLSVGLHLFVVSPWLAIFAWLMTRDLSPRTTELLAASLPLVVVAQIEASFFATRSHMADQYQYFVLLAAMFGNSILRLRVRVAAVMSSLIMVAHSLVCWIMLARLEPSAIAMSLICLAGSIYITLISNAVSEVEFRRDWLRRRSAELQAGDLTRDNDKLSRLSRIDPLTGVRNRRGFDLAIEQFLANASARDVEFCVIMLDVDHFKGFNDTYGHAEGDRCLHTLAMVMNDMLCKDKDVLARYGGEEFLVFVPDCQLNEGIALAERIRRALVAAAIPHHRHDGGRVVTASLGVAEGRLTGVAALHEAIAHADMALYDAKNGGRNRVEPPFIRCRPSVVAEVEMPAAWSPRAVR